MTKKIIQLAAMIVVMLVHLDSNAQSHKANIIIEKEIVIDAEISKSWHVLGPEFADAYKWASTVNKSEGKGNFINGETYSERVCSTPMGTLNEKILNYSVENRLLVYQFEGMPKMVRFAMNTWHLTALDNNQTKLSFKMEMEVGGIGKMMKPMMKMKMAKMAGHTIEEFKYYVEQGQPHPRKLRAMKKYKG
ncbi:MAG: SRPBCC family protein [Chitinophagaceae bacterium]|nr:SRPBCC family protein [Chitinophagaceae bacterium]